MRLLKHIALAALSIGLTVAGIACADDKPPVISRISVSDLAGTTATINWVTDERASSWVLYSLDLSYSSAAGGNTAFTTTHTVTLSSLSGGVTYHYKVQSTDAHGNRAMSEDQTFDTPWAGPNGETLHEYVDFEGYRIAGADGGDIELFNNPKARDVTWTEMKQFLLNDQTDRITYNATFVCADFAETLHNNAEEAGIRAAYVSIDFGPTGICSVDPITYCRHCYGKHACNAFQTSDRGIIYIDDTGASDGTGEDTTVSIISIGQIYQPVSIFSSTQWCDMGTVRDFTITW